VNNIRLISKSDLASVLIIERAAYTFPWTVNIFETCLRNGHYCWVLESDGVLAAYGILALGAGESHILNLCVHPDYQRRGLGKTMLRHLLEVADKHHANVTYLEVRPSNFPAIRLYLDSGFDEIGVHRDYYPAKIGREDALILAYSHTPDPP